MLNCCYVVMCFNFTCNTILKNKEHNQRACPCVLAHCRFENKCFWISNHTHMDILGVFYVWITKKIGLFCFWACQNCWCFGSYLAQIHFSLLLHTLLLKQLNTITQSHEIKMFKSRTKKHLSVNQVFKLFKPV